MEKQSEILQFASTSVSDQIPKNQISVVESLQNGELKFH